MSAWLRLSTLALPTLALVVVLGACRPLSSEHPLGHRSSGEDLVRNWAVDDMRLEVTRLGPEKLALKVMSQSQQDSDDPDALYYEALPSVIDDKPYLSIKQVFPDEMVRIRAKKDGLSFDEVQANFARQDDRINGYFLARYRLAEKDGMLKLNFYLLDEKNKMALKSLSKGELSGGTVQAVKMDGSVDDIVYVTSSSDALDAYIIKNSDQNLHLFDLKITGWINVL